MRVAALVTGGKDSALALYRALKLGYEVKVLVTMIPQREDSWMFHFPNIHLAGLFAKAVEIPLVKAETVGVRETELEDLKSLLATLAIEGVVSGAISSRYQKERIDKVCRELNLESIAPLWQVDSMQLLKEIINLNFEVIIVGVYAYGFDQNWLGRKIDSATIKNLVELNDKYQISLVGEGGEYETLVLDAPFFKKRIQVLQTERIWENHSGYLLVKEAKLVDKAEKVY
ncbi:MAG: TIGR00289 family protein [Candidatus Bathyarchaeota archaeon]|nr:TIGR00289 family protein [Candidatus Bathyarchaeota archaeon]MDH5623989.1 TIGR00289 family protein [Candidatus Bathyarchaeota archaeon]MDH5635931.1 TIGR00289 family protein [Candidatus Bathyarchaeota archaeon]MDH5701915.1 TIGR00289 family protein [Candidatus Bathyarchaeota archaeon]